MADQQGQNVFDGEKSEHIIDQWGDLQGPSTMDDQQKLLQNQVHVCEDLKPLRNCSWVDCAEQVDFILFSHFSFLALNAIMHHL